jgi:hypothetical protein
MGLGLLVGHGLNENGAEAQAPYRPCTAKSSHLHPGALPGISGSGLYSFRYAHTRLSEVGQAGFLTGRTYQLPALPGPNQALKRSEKMITNLPLQPIISLIAGIMILFIPRLLNYIVAIYLIVVGILGLTHGRM